MHKQKSKMGAGATTAHQPLELIQNFDIIDEYMFVIFDHTLEYYGGNYMKFNELDNNIWFRRIVSENKCIELTYTDMFACIERYMKTHNNSYYTYKYYSNNQKQYVEIFVVTNPN